MRILVADDEPTIRKTLSDALVEAGHKVEAVPTAEQALWLAQSRFFDCLIADLRLPGMQGMELLRKVKEITPETYVIMITGHGTIESAVEAVKAGAVEYVTKPFYNEDILMRLSRIEQELRLKGELSQLRGEITGKREFAGLIGGSEAMQRLFKTIEAAARNDYDVLIEGESGTGKELVARAIHKSSTRISGKFVPVSCAALPESLLEDELFGHEKGAFTGAEGLRAGRFELAADGTLFLDDIDDMTPATQVKLLRVLQERCFERIGGMKTITVNIRVIAASKLELREKMGKGSFREDLYYRLSVVPISIPPLRARPEDVPLLVEHFIKLYGGGMTYEVEPGTYEAMASYGWPGNVRELENSVKRALALSTGPGTLSRKYLVPRAQAPSQAPRSAIPFEGSLRPLKSVVVETEKEHIKAVLQATEGSRTRAAEILGISRKSLWEKMKAYRIS